MRHTDEEQLGAASAGTLVFLVEDQLLQCRCASSAVFSRPGNARPAGIGQSLLPLTLVRDIVHVVVPAEPRRVGPWLWRGVRREPVTHLEPKFLVALQGHVGAP